MLTALRERLWNKNNFSNSMILSRDHELYAAIGAHKKQCLMANKRNQRQAAAGLCYPGILFN
jgi:hypothetical protein